MSVAIDSFSYKLPYDSIFGGVSAMMVEHFMQVNGFSNMFWGWGGEDDDMFNRLQEKKLYISRYPARIARYKVSNSRTFYKQLLCTCSLSLYFHFMNWQS